MIAHRFPAEARCLGRDRRLGLALISYPDGSLTRWVRNWFADAPATRAVVWYDDAMDRDSRETTTR
jgi:hypothetical protein